MKTTLDTDCTAHARLFHECSPDVAEQIREEGLRAEPSATADEVDRVDGRYCCPKEVPPGGALDYGVRLVYRLLAEKRPDHLPPHNGSVFFFGATRHSMARQCRVTVDLPIDEYEVVAAPWDVANDLFMDVMREFEIVNSHPADALDEQIEAYWDGAFRVESVDEVEAGYEYYVTEDVAPEHVVDWEHINRTNNPKY